MHTDIVFSKRLVTWEIYIWSKRSRGRKKKNPKNIRHQNRCLKSIYVTILRIHNEHCAIKNISKLHEGPSVPVNMHHLIGFGQIPCIICWNSHQTKAITPVIYINTQTGITALLQTFIVVNIKLVLCSSFCSTLVYLYHTKTSSQS